jgi:hypothetical protein
MHARAGLVLADDGGMRSSIHFVLLAASVSTGCGDSSSSPRPDAGTEIDAPPDTPQEPGTAIVVETDVAPSLIAYRDGAGAWTTPKMIDVDTFELDVHGPYVVLVACDDGAGSIITWQLARTPDDERELYMTCYEPLPDTVSVTGTMVQAGRVSAGFSSDSSQTASWSFDVGVDPGTRDVFAYDADRIVSRRNVNVAGATAIEPLDLTQGVALVTTPLVATNATTSETVSSSINVTSTNTSFFTLFRGAAAITKLTPAGFLIGNDRQSATVTARLGVSSRALRRSPFRVGDPTDFVLPAALGSVSYEQAGTSVKATWTTLPAHDFVEITLDAFSEDFTTYFFHDVEISPAYIAATGATSMTIDTDIPGYKPAWRIDYTKEYFRALLAVDFRSGEIATSTRSETVNAPSLLPSLRRPASIERVLERRDVLRNRVRGG